MRLALRYFAGLREAMGCEAEQLEAAGVRCVADLIGLLQRRDAAGAAAFADAARIHVAINGVIASRESGLRDGDCVDLFPPVTGG